MRQTSSYKETLILKPNPHPTITKPITNTIIQHKPHPSITKPVANLTTKHIPAMEAPRNWMNMDLLNPNAIPIERIEQLDVYIEPRLELKPSNRFLERAGFVFAGPATNDPYLAHKVLEYLGQKFGRHPQEFSVYRVENRFGDLMVLFPNALMAQQATRHGVCRLHDGTEVCMHPYSPGLSMIFNPTYNRARIRLHNVPHQHWNKGDVATLISGFGYPIRVAPYFSNGNFEYLKVFVACKSTAKIPYHLNLTVDPYSTKPYVELEGWMPSREGRVPPPPGNGPDTRRGPPRSRHQNNSHNSSPKEGSSQPAGPSRKRMPSPEHTNSRVDRRRGKAAYRWVAKTVKQTPPVLVQTGEKTPNIGIRAVLDTPTSANGNVREIQKAVKEIQNTVKDGQNKFLPQQAKFFIPDTVRPLPIKPNPALSINPNPISVLRNPNPITILINQNPITLFNITQPSPSNLDLPELVQPISILPPLEAHEAVNEEANRLQITPFVAAQNKEDQNNEIESIGSQSEGLPPGFEGRFGFINDTQEGQESVVKKPSNLKPVRRSKRIEERYPEDRPRYGSSSRSAKKSVKKKLFVQSYLDSADPMTETQAIELMGEAGVELKDELADKVLQVVRGESTGQEMVIFKEAEASGLEA